MNGGPAFPSNFVASLNGMSLRDFFAATALHGILSAGELWTNAARQAGGDVVQLAYSYANAMLAEREKP
jgi:uncharacterized membrane protein YdjX (TVP38/TMEM64 family)